MTKTEFKIKIKSDDEVKEGLIENYPPDKFNWWALLFGAFYYMYHGMWGKAVFYVILSILSVGILAIPLSIYMGFRHNKHYLEHKGIHIKVTNK